MTLPGAAISSPPTHQDPATNASVFPVDTSGAPVDPSSSPYLGTSIFSGCSEARNAAEFYAATFPDSHVGPAAAAPSDFPGGNAGDEVVVEFTVLGRDFPGLNGGSTFKPNEAVSFMVLTEDQAETDRYWDAIVDNGGAESECGWCKDRWGFSWQITPRTLIDALMAEDHEAKRAFDAMAAMRKIDVAAIDAARRGGS